MWGGLFPVEYVIIIIIIIIIIITAIIIVINFVLSYILKELTCIFKTIIFFALILK